MRLRGWLLAGCALVATGCPSSTQPDPDTCAENHVTPPVLDLVAAPAAGVTPTWDNFAGPFVNAYCVGCHNPQVVGCGGSSCHAAGDPTIMDFRDRQQVTARASTIRCGVALTQDGAWNCGSIAPNIFPKGNPGCTNPFPSEALRTSFIAWVDAGTP